MDCVSFTYLEHFADRLQHAGLVELVPLVLQLADLRVCTDTTQLAQPAPQIRSVDLPTFRHCDSTSVESKVQQCLLQVLVVHLRLMSEHIVTQFVMAYMAFNAAKLYRHEVASLLGNG